MNALKNFDSLYRVNYELLKGIAQKFLTISKNETLGRFHYQFAKHFHHKKFLFVTYKDRKERVNVCKFTINQLEQF